MERFTTKFILMLSCFLLFCLHSHVKGQGLSFTLEVTVSNATCYTNGEVAIELTNITPLVKKIRYELTSTTIAGSGKLQHEISNHSGTNSQYFFKNLRGGTYNVNVTVYDQSGSSLSRVQNKVIASSYVEPSIIIGDRTPSVKCMNSGSVSFYFLGGENGGSDDNFKYNLKYRASSGDPWTTKEEWTKVIAGSYSYNKKNKYTLGNLAAGEYSMELIDECNYVILHSTFRIETSEDILPDAAVMKVFFKKTDSEYGDCQSLTVKLQNLPETSAFAPYWNDDNKIGKYQYAWGTEETTNPATLTFSDFWTDNVGAVDFYGTPHYKYYIENPSKRPKLYIKFKNAGCSDNIKGFSCELSPFIINNSFRSYKCSDSTYTVRLSIGGSQIGCGDIKLKIDGGGESIPIPNPGLSFNNLLAHLDVPNLKAGVLYKLVATDGDGLEVNSSISLSPIDMSKDIYMISEFDDPCKSGSEGTILVGSNHKAFSWRNCSVELISCPPEGTPPMFSGSPVYTFGNYTPKYFYLFSSPDNLATPKQHKILTGWYELAFSNTACANLKKDTVRYYYAGGTPYSIDDFSFEKDKICGGNMRVNINGENGNLVKQGAVDLPVYIQVYNESGSREESVRYYNYKNVELTDRCLIVNPGDTTNNWERRGYMVFQKSGTYNVRVSADADFSLGKFYPCLIKTQNITIDIKAFALDSLKSGSYACEEGLKISVSAKGGGYQTQNSDGSKTDIQLYSYELYKSRVDADSASNIPDAQDRNPVISKHDVKGGITASLEGKIEDTDISEIVKGGLAHILVIDAACTNGKRFVVSVPIAKLTEEGNFSLTGGGKFCIGDTVTLNATHLGDVTYEWSEWNGTQYEKIATNQTPQLILNGVQSTGIYRVSVSLCDAIYEAYDTVYVAPEVLIWRGDAGDNNWNNPNNWGIAYDKVTGLGEGPLEVGTAIYTVPGECTTVHIPGNARRYPDFAKTYGEPVCDAIVYHFGGETGSPHLLKYNRAYIEFNWGYDEISSNEGVFKNWEDDFPAYKNNSAGDTLSPRIKSRDRWYMISAPLMKVASGDFSVAGYPKTFQRLFNAVNPQSREMTPGDFCNPFNTNDIDLKTYSNSALAVWVPSYNGSIVGLANHKNLDDLCGKIRLPYIEYDEKYAGGAYQMYHGKGHAMHRYNHNVEKDGENISIFPYYYEGDLSPYPEDKDPAPGEMPRKIGSKGAFEDPSRFVFEEDSTRKIKTLNGIALYEMMVKGNNHTDPAKRDDDDDGYGTYVMIGNPFMSHLDFKAFHNANKGEIEPFYKLFLSNAWETKRVSEEKRMSIAPLQSFVIKLCNDTTKKLIFPVSGENNVSTTGREDMLKAATLGIRDNEIQIELSNSVGKTEAIVAWGVQDLKNIDILYNTSYPKVPQVFVVGEDFMYNSVQYEKNNRTEIPLGVYSALKGEMTLSFNGVADNTMLNRLSLWDKKLNKEQDIYINPVYTFDHQDDMEADRFVLRVENSQTNTETTSSYFNVYVDKGSLYVQSSVEIQRIRMCAANGVVAMEDNPVGKFYYSKSTGLVAGVYILSVDLVNGNREVRKIVIE